MAALAITSRTDRTPRKRPILPQTLCYLTAGWWLVVGGTRPNHDQPLTTNHQPAFLRSADAEDSARYGSTGVRGDLFAGRVRAGTGGCAARRPGACGCTRWSSRWTR